MMRQWLRYIVENPALYEDFIKWTYECENAVSNAVLNAIEANELEKASRIVHERGVYTQLRKSVNAEVRERQSQINYEEQMKGGH